MTQATSFSKDHLAAIAAHFCSLGSILTIDVLGSGNVNDTFLVTLDGTEQFKSFVLQRLNNHVFDRPDLVMNNMLTLVNHVESKLASVPFEVRGRRWEMPKLLPTVGLDAHWIEENGSFWRSISHIDSATSAEVIDDHNHAIEVGYALGRFHYLISDLSNDKLSDTLENFHVTPAYLLQHDLAVNTFNKSVGQSFKKDRRLDSALSFVDTHRGGVDVLELALSRGELKKRPIHGDPKINNVMIDDISRQAVGLIDLDTVKPGLVHYDIGDCLRSCCNQAGEETTDLSQVYFDLSLCEAILEGYLSEARCFLSKTDFEYIPECIKLIPFELGLRFLTDHLNGNIYFKTYRPEQNLDRAEVQFRLTQSIESQWTSIVDLIDRLRRKR